ncbi:MAG: type I restriction enzyme HsdR N-terminal domain-containing protein, partial [Petrimonas sp.]|nr:type I restriction enzyme HsdR N-terminal domain-containing protein [Petrimonas sp.]
MYALNLPSFDAKISKTDRSTIIFDRLRRKYVSLTPEEWVRQHFVNYLIIEKNYPASLIANEAKINLNSLSRRCDTVVYNSRLEPLVILEYKSPDVKITQEVFDQIVRYNIVLRVKYLIVSNGLSHYCCEMDYENQTFRYVNEIPDYDQLAVNDE